jgi:hypothetical protein
MNLNRAVHILSKFFQVNEDVFNKAMSSKNGSPLKKDSVIGWATQVQEGALDTKEIPGSYRLTRQQHEFLVGNISGF